MFEEKIQKNYMFFTLAVTIGIFFRFVVMSLGHNFDFESYCIVGEIAGNFRNVYAETSRYNYGFIFFIIQGFLYRLSQIGIRDWILLYRVLIVSTLTLTDLCISLFLAKRYSIKSAILFFLNPVSIIISGYHNQFDNIAVFLALLTIPFYNEEEKCNKNDIAFILLISLSLITKHILFIFPIFLLFKKNLPIKKKILFAFVPPIIFLLSFIPFIIFNESALKGVLKNVFLYRSVNNAPLLCIFYKLVHFPNGLKIFVFAGMMAILGFIIRNETYEKTVLIYFIAMVSFSSAIANQYLVIPMVSLCILAIAPFNTLYMVTMGTYLILENAGLCGLQLLYRIFPDSVFYKISNLYVRRGYMIGAWLLFGGLLDLLLQSFKKKK